MNASSVKVLDKVLVHGATVATQLSSYVCKELAEISRYVVTLKKEKQQMMRQKRS